MKISSDTLIEDDLLASILNDKNIIQIDNKVYKLDFKNQLCYVLLDITPDNIILLETPEKLTNKVKVYTFDDEILYLENDNTARVDGCKQPGAARCKSEFQDVVAYNVGSADGLPEKQWYDYKYKAKHVYEKAGIFFSLQSKLKYMRRKSVDRHVFPWSEYETDISGSWIYEYKQRKKCNVISNSINAELCTRVLVAKGDKTGNGQGRLGRIYASSKALSKYKVSSSYTIKIEGCNDATNLPVDITLDDICWGYPISCVCK